MGNSFLDCPSANVSCFLYTLTGYRCRSKYCPARFAETFCKFPHSSSSYSVGYALRTDALLPTSGPSLWPSWGPVFPFKGGGRQRNPRLSVESIPATDRVQFQGRRRWPSEGCRYQTKDLREKKKDCFTVGVWNWSLSLVTVAASRESPEWEKPLQIGM